MYVTCRATADTSRRVQNRSVSAGFKRISSVRVHSLTPQPRAALVAVQKMSQIHEINVSKCRWAAGGMRPSKVMMETCSCWQGASISEGGFV